MDLATTASVQKCMPRPLTDAELERARDSLIAEASALVEGHLGFSFDPMVSGQIGFTQVPAVVELVVSRMVARFLLSGTEVPVGADSTSMVAGPFTETVRYGEASSSGPWLTSSDKTMLRTAFRVTSSSVKLRSPWQ